jgi:hypothetical protein
LKKYPKFISGFVLGGLLFGSVGAFAATGGEMLEVFYNVKDIKINKVSKMPSDNKPFIYNGSTYVPLRFVAEALGQPVNWDNNTQTVLIGETDQEGEFYLGKDIKSMNSQLDNGVFSSYSDGKQLENNRDNVGGTSDSGKDNIGGSYNNFIAMHAYHSVFAEYPLNGEYKKFKAKVGLDDSTKSTKGTSVVEFYVDEKKVNSLTIKAGDFPKDIEIDVTNANKISFKLVVDGNPTQVDLFNARVTK